VITSKDGEGILQVLQKNNRAGDCKTNSPVFCQDLKNVCLDIVEESVPSVIQKETALRLRAGDAGAQTTLGKFASTDQKAIFTLCILLS
jgi:hypothetical protein